MWGMGWPLVDLCWDENGIKGEGAAEHTEIFRPVVEGPHT